MQKRFQVSVNEDENHVLKCELKFIAQGTTLDDTSAWMKRNYLPIVPQHLISMSCQLGIGTPLFISNGSRVCSLESRFFVWG